MGGSSFKILTKTGVIENFGSKGRGLENFDLKGDPRKNLTYGGVVGEFYEKCGSRKIKYRRVIQNFDPKFGILEMCT